MVLDDVVHPDQVRGLLDMTDCGAFVVTSRMRLAALVATHGPAVLRLGALSPQESHALLVAVLGRERVAAETPAAHALTDTCGHVPLALRIVAARLLTRPKLRLTDHAAWLRRDLPARLTLPDDPRMSVSLTLDSALDRLPAPVADAHLRLARLDGQITAPAAARAPSLPRHTPRRRWPVPRPCSATACTNGSADLTSFSPSMPRRCPPAPSRTRRTRHRWRRPARCSTWCCTDGAVTSPPRTWRWIRSSPRQPSSPGSRTSSPVRPPPPTR